MSRGTADEHRTDEHRADEDRTARTGARSNTDGARSSHRGTSGAGAMLAYDDFAVTNDPLIGIPGRPSAGAAIRRRKIVWLVAAVVGLALGIGLFKVMPPPYKATATVYITEIPGVLPTDQILTEVALAQSRTVAEQAMHTLRLQTFMGRDTVLAPTDQIITFTVKASSAADAGARAAALAVAYLHVRADRLGVSLRRTMTALNSQIATEKNHLTALAAKIATVQAEPTSIKQQNQLASLMAEQPQAQAALKALKAAAKHFGASTHVSNTTVVSGSRVLDKGQAAPRSKIKYPVLYAVGGLLGGGQERIVGRGGLLTIRGRPGHRDGLGDRVGPRLHQATPPVRHRQGTRCSGPAERGADSGQQAVSAARPGERRRPRRPADREVPARGVAAGTGQGVAGRGRRG